MSTKLNKMRLLLLFNWLSLSRFPSLSDWNSFVLHFHGFHIRSCNGENPIWRQLGLNLAHVAGLGQHISSHKVSGNVSVLVLLLLVLPLNSQDVVSSDFDRNFFRLELLHVKVGLELVLVKCDGGSGVPLGSIGAPVSQVASRGPGQQTVVEIMGLENVFRVQAQSKVLVQNSGWPQQGWAWQPRVVEQQW